MKILNLSLDKSLADPNSGPAKRIVGFSEISEKYTIITKSLTDTEVVLTPKLKVYGIGLSGGKAIAFAKWFFLGLKLIKKEKYDIVTSQDPYYIGVLSFVLAKISKARFEVQVHGLERYCGIRKKIFNFVVKRADLIRVVSQRMRKEVILLTKAKEEKIYVLPVFVDVEKFKTTNRNYEAKEKFIFLTIGRLVSVKNIEIQIGAMEEVVKKYPRIKLDIVGDGVLREKLEELVKEKKLEDSVKFYGFQKETKPFYEKTDVFVLSSSSEGWGMVVVEAAASGLPIVMTDVGCAGEILKNNESALIIPVNKKGELVQAMIKMIENEELREKIGKGAKRDMESLLTKEQYLSNLKNNWEKLIK